MNEMYSVVQTQLGNLTRYQTNAYTECSVVNMTSDSVVLIDINNNQQIIPPVVTSGVTEDVINIFQRTGVGPTIGPNGSQLALNGFTIKIEKYKLRNEPVYIKEINKLLCTEEQAMTAKHPFSQVSYDEGMEACIDQLARTVDSAPAFKLLANDPTGSYNELWTILDTEVTKIPVTHLTGEYFTLSVITMRDGKLFKEDLDLSILTSGTENIVKFQNKVIPWVTTTLLNATELAKTFKWITPEVLEEYKNKLIQENKRTMDQTKASLDAKNLDLSTKLMTMQTILDRTSAERDEYKMRYTGARADGQTQLDQMKNLYAMMQMRNDYGISNNNLMLANWKQQSAEKENNFKIWALIAAAALPVVGLMAMKMFENSFKR